VPSSGNLSEPITGTVDTPLLDGTAGPLLVLHGPVGTFYPNAVANAPLSYESTTQQRKRQMIHLTDLKESTHLNACDQSHQPRKSVLVHFSISA
jgi:hypothetical protein